MKAQNLSICIPNKGCNKDCPYCISKMTGYIHSNEKLMKRNLLTLKNFAKQLNVSSVLITGKGEPLYDNESVENCIFYLNEFKEYITELQTNGIVVFKNNKEIFENLYKANLNILAISIDNVDDITMHQDLYKILKEEYNFIIRFSLNLTGSFSKIGFNDLINLCKASYCQQLTLRKITIPKNLQQTKLAIKTKIWIQANIDYGIYDNLIKQFNLLKSENKVQKLRRLSNGAVVYDINGVSFTHFDYCIQDDNNEDDIRSLIYQENGHAYDNWNSNASILF